MTAVALVGFLALVALASGQQYAGYEYQDARHAAAAYQDPRQAAAAAAAAAYPDSRQAAAAYPDPRQAAAAPRPYARAIEASPSPRAQATAQARPTPVPILKQINRHNDDGSYTYGYEGADGSFKIETKLPTGEVMGKYGYVDDTGKLRVIDYGANRFGFQPAGEGITVAPPTLVDETTAREGEAAGSFAEYDDGSIYAPQPRPARPQKRPQQVFVPRASPEARSYPAQVATPSYQQIPVSYAATPAPSAAPSPAPQVRYVQPAEQAPAPVRYIQPVPQQEVRYVQPEAAAAAPQHQQQIRYVQPAAPAPARFAPPTRRATPARYTPPVQVQQVARTSAPVPPRATVANAAPAYANPSPAPVREQYAASGSLLDQLAKQYALPSGVGGQPLHDITFGSYASQTSY